MPVSVPVSVPPTWRTAAAVLLLVVTACGREAPPLPPIIRVAERTADLSAYQRGDEAVLRWSYPSMTTSGEVLTDIEAIEVWRAELPLAQEPPPPVTAQDRRMRRQLLESQGEVLVVLVPDQISSATRGPDLFFRDDLRRWQQGLEPGSPEKVLWYGVRTICCRRRPSELSNVVRLLPEEPPPPPTALRLSARAAGIDVLWDQTIGLKTLVERSPDGTVWTAVTAEPVGGQSWNDTTAAQGRSWSYRLRSVREIAGGGRVVGQPSEPVRVSHPDTYPPPTPTDMVCLPEGSRVRVRWLATPGAASYRIIRRDGEGVETVLAEAVETVELVDDAPPLGELIYRVVAVDAVGNSSQPARCSVVMGAVP